jgi:hypothetical protein
MGKCCKYPQQSKININFSETLARYPRTCRKTSFELIVVNRVHLKIVNESKHVMGLQERTERKTRDYG